MKLRDELMCVERHGRRMPLYIAVPDKTGSFPAVIIVHEIFGLNDHIKDIARRFAEHGFVALAPDLFDGAEGLPEDRNNLDAMRAVWAKMPDSQIIDDLEAVYHVAAARTDVLADKVGTIGYCMGGAMALMFASSTPRIAWIADYYGRIYYPQLSETKPKHPIDYIERLHCAFLGLFAGKDELITAPQIDELRARLEGDKQLHEIKVYPQAEHAFFNDTRQFYNEEAAKDAWARTLDFISKAINVPVAK